MDIKIKLFPHQKKLLCSKEPVVYFRAGRGSGKSYICALIATLSLIQGKRVICLAQTNASSREVIVPEILNHLNKIIPGKYSFNKSTGKITYKDGVIFLSSYESMESLRGFTKISLCICDEVALAPPDLFTVISFCMRGEGIKPRIIMASTPRSDNWITQYVKNNNVPIINAKTSDNKTITEEQINVMRATCIDENTWKREFYGEECDDGSAGTLFTNDVLIDCEQVKENTQKGYAIGIDCSGLGVDNNVIVVRSINKIKKVVKKRTATAAEMCGIVKGLIEEFGRGDLSHIAIDEAYGLDLYNRLKEAGYNAQVVPFGGKSSESVYLNNRAEMYCTMKKQFEEFGMIGLNEDMKRELNATRYILSNSNKIQIIPKSEIKLIVGHSPDTADALALTYTQPIVPRALTEYRLRQDREDMRDL